MAIPARWTHINDAVPLDNTWCWVCALTRGPIVAFRDSSASGGWTNTDTWEDWEQEFVWWIALEVPFPLPLSS